MVLLNDCIVFLSAPCDGWRKMQHMGAAAWTYKKQAEGKHRDVLNG